MPDPGCGASTPTPFAYFDRDTCSWKTSQASLFEDLIESSPTLPSSGSMRSGAVFRRRPLVHHTGVTDCSSVQLLKTPTAQLATNGGSQNPDKRKAGGHGPTLADEVEHLLPTPTATDAKGSRNATANRQAPKASTNHNGWTLTDVFWSGDDLGPQSEHGKGSSDDPPLFRLSPEPEGDES